MTEPRTQAAPPKTDRPRAVGYFRVSTPGQAEDDRWSLPKQRADFARHCAEHGYEPAGEYQDVMSGGRSDRPGYQQMIADAKAGRFEHVVVADTSRFGRDREEAVYRFLWLKIECGVGVDFIHESHRDLADFVDEADYAHREREKIGRRVRRALNMAAESGKMINRTPFGYERDGDGLRPVEPAATTVRRVYDLYTEELLGDQAIARKMHAEGRPASEGRPFSASAVRQILTRPAYRGVYRWGEVEIEGALPALVSSAQWLRAQEIRARKKELRAPRAHRSEYLLGGLVRCGYCGYAMTGVNRKHSGQKYVRYYRCSRRYQSPVPHGDPYTKAEELETAVVEMLTERLGSADRAESDTAREVEEAKREVEQAKAAVSRIEGRFEKNLDLYYTDRITVEQFEHANELVREQTEAAQARLNSSLDRLHAAVRAAEQVTQASQSTGTLAALYQAGEILRAKVILQSLVDHVVVTGDDAEVKRRLV